MKFSSRYSDRLPGWLLALAVLSPFAHAQAPSNATDSELLWGPYRPNLYFGVRPRLPLSLTTGLLWAAVEDYQQAQASFRFTCEQNEGMAGYGWEEYDVRTGGKQVIHDAQNHIDITTEFVKIPDGKHGGSWGARISGKLRDDAPPDMASTVVFYMGMEGPPEGSGALPTGKLEFADRFDQFGYTESVNFNGNSNELGDFSLEITQGPASNQHPIHQHPSYQARPLDRTMVTSLQAPNHAVWQGKTVLFQALKTTVDQYIELYGETNHPPCAQGFTIGTTNAVEGNMHFVQKVFRGSFQFDVLFSSGSAPEPMTSDKLNDALKASSKKFGKAYKENFPAQSPYNKPQYDAFSKSLFSNLIGGIGYFYGEQVIDNSYLPEYEEENEGFWEEAAEARSRSQPKLLGPYELFTAIPSRPFFPRGFLWDEGFHLLPVLDWDLGLTIEILRSWFRLMNEDGWIAREQILGAEARSKVPPEFQVQYPHYANPPTLFLVLESLLDKLNSKDLSKADKEYLTEILRSFYPLLKRHYEWYRKTQKGDLKSYDREAFSQREAYRWRGRTPAHILTSGLDDYPRAQPPHPGELHVDLMSWVGMMTRSIKRVAAYLGESDDAKEYSGYETAITRNLDDLHWDAKEKTYCDATIDDYEESVHACHKGYVSIFPFMTAMLAPDHPHLGDVLDLIADPEELWSNHGIRSLSKQDALYGTDENYWRSPVWMNMNYLVLDNLLTVARAKSSPHQKKAAKMYQDLRKNLVETVYKSWKETGFAWEQYDPETGKGQRTQHFTGWTSLVVKIMCMPDLSKDGGVEHGEL